MSINIKTGFDYGMRKQLGMRRLTASMKMSLEVMMRKKMKTHREPQRLCRSKLKKRRSSVKKRWKKVAIG